MREFTIDASTILVVSIVSAGTTGHLSLCDYATIMMVGGQSSVVKPLGGCSSSVEGLIQLAITTYTTLVSELASPQMHPASIAAK